MSYFALKQVTWGALELFVESNQLGAANSFTGSAAGEISNATRAIQRAGAVARFGSLAGDVYQLVDENREMCRKATGYNRGF